MFMRLASFRHSKELFPHRQESLGKGVDGPDNCRCCDGKRFQVCATQDVNESYLTFITSQAIGLRHTLEFH